MAEAVNLLIDGRILFDICITAGNICFWLIIIKITDEVMYFVFWKELLKLTKELRRKRLVVCQNQRRHATLSDNIRHRKGLTATRCTKQCLLALTSFQATK